MEQMEVEVEEKEVRRIYCDDCGNNCTDQHKVTPKHLCPQCSGESTVYRTVGRMMRATTTSDNYELSHAILVAIVYPLAFPFACDLQTVNVADKQSRLAMLSHTAGTLLWGVPLALLLIFLL